MKVNPCMDNCKSSVVDNGMMIVCSPKTRSQMFVNPVNVMVLKINVEAFINGDDNYLMFYSVPS